MIGCKPTFARVTTRKLRVCQADKALFRLRENDQLRPVGSNSLASIRRTEARSADRGEVLDCPPQHLEQDSSRPTEHQDAVHRSHRPFQPPFLYRRDVTVAKRGVINEGKIEQIAAGRRRAYDAVHRRPDENLEQVRNHQDNRSRNHDGHQVQPRPRRVPQARRAGDADGANGHQSMDHDVDHADDGADKELIRHRPSHLNVTARC